MKRFPFLDWMRGLAIVLMIQCHTFNSFARMDVREGGPYVLSQFVGGMAAPLFLFMAGMTFAFQMESVARRERDPLARWLTALRRGGVRPRDRVPVPLLELRRQPAAARLARADQGRHPEQHGPGDAVPLGGRAVRHQGPYPLRSAGGDRGGRGAAPLVANLPWGDTPAIVQEYLAPGQGQGRGRFPLFPNAAYLAFGLAIGSIVKALGAGAIRPPDAMGRADRLRAGLHRPVFFEYPVFDLHEDELLVR